MTRGYTQSEIMRKSVELYKWLVGLEAKADGFSYSYVPGACARSGLVIEGEHVHKRVLVSGFTGGVEYAQCLMKGMLMRRPSVELDQVALVAPLSACCQNMGLEFGKVNLLVH
ncbi:hypothetical protein ACFX12_022575 [Malus domestica]